MTAETRTGARWLSRAAVVAGFLVIVVGVFLATRFGNDPSLVTSPLIGKPVPDLTLAPLYEEESPLRLSDLRGDIVVINFWASWCLACREEHPALLQAAAAYADLGVTFVGVDYQDSVPEAVRYLEEMGRSPETIYVFDGDSAAGFAFGVRGVPETFFVDRQGTVVGKVSGAVNYPLLAATIDNIILGRAVESVRTGEVQNR